ncbi:PH domain-containing protein [Demequina lutea]|uniref:Putative membrane protein n=1 Tax=Demequina lutea TaxID=431489 RepID=A0A7Y9Z9G9_9MICO|nr:PH domain-containing protein [Demequina lutea]NYI40473.1 putative membrane protein [Demequina lutea]
MSLASERVYSAPREWVHVHPVSPLLGGWAAFAAVVGLWFYNGPAKPAPGQPRELHVSIFLLAGAAVVAAIFAIAFGYLTWWFHTFRITDEAVEQRKGWLFRQQRQARLDRLQAVDVVQPLLGRIFGFAKITIEVAGGSKSGIQLHFLRLADAEALRNEILALAAGFRADVASARGSVPEHGAREFSLRTEAESFRLAPAPGSARTSIAAAVERPLVAVPVSRLVASILLSWGTIVGAIAMLVAVAVSIVVGLLVPDVNIVGAIFGGGFIGVLTGVAGMASSALKTLNRGLNFRLGISRDGVRIAHGLLETTRQTVPPGRVQAVSFSQSVLWRRRDWWQVVINVAGYQDNQDAVSTLIPVGTTPEALLALWAVMPDLGDPDAPGTIARALVGQGGDGGFVPSPPSARWVDPWQWHRRGVRATDTALLIRSGRWVRRLTVLPHERTQSLSLRQGPLQRALGLATVEVHSTKGVVKPVAHHLAVADAIELVNAQAARARQRRSLQTPEQWMVKVGISEVADERQ